MRYLVAVLLIFICCNAYAEQVFNPHTGQWETAPQGSTSQYNPYSGEWSEQPEEAKVEYNPYNDKWEWDSGHN